MDGTVTYTAVLTIVVPIVSTALGVQAWIYKMVSDEAKHRKELEKDMEEKLEKSRQDRHGIRNELFVLKEQVARENVTHTTMERFENRIISSIDKLGERLDKALTASNHTTIVK